MAGELQIGAAMDAALRLATDLDPEWVAISLRTLSVSIAGTAAAALVAVPLGAALALSATTGARGLLAAISALSALPPAVVGLVAALLVAPGGPLGAAALTATPAGVALALALLALPLVALAAARAVDDERRRHVPTLRALRAGRALIARTLLVEARFPIAAGCLAALGRALGETGAALALGAALGAGALPAQGPAIAGPVVALGARGGEGLPMALALGATLALACLALRAAAALVRGREDPADA